MRVGICESPVIENGLLYLQENELPKRFSIGPFHLDSAMRDVVELHHHLHNDKHDDPNQWSGPTSINLSCTLLNNLIPPSHLQVSSRRYQLLMTPGSLIPSQVLFSLSNTSIPHILSHNSSTWIQSLLFSNNCCRVLDLNLADVSAGISLVISHRVFNLYSKTKLLWSEIPLSFVTFD